MSVTQMEGAAQQRLSTIAGNAAGRFSGGRNLHDATIIAFEQITLAEHGTAHGEDRDLFTRDECGAQTTFFAQLVGKHKFAINLVSVSHFGV